MDKVIIERKLDSLLRCLRRIADKTPENPQILKEDPDLQDILVLNLSRAVQLCVDIGTHTLSNQGLPVPDTMGNTFNRMAEAGLIDQTLAENLRKSVGFRNIAVHNYSTLDMEIVYAIASNHLNDFHAFARHISEHLV